MSKIFIDKFKQFLVLRKSDNIDEKIKDFTDFIYGSYYKNVIYDEIVDFLDITRGKPTRWETFAKYIRKQFPVSNFPKVLDVGCGSAADLTSLLVKYGYDVTAIDPKVDEIEKLRTIRKLFDYTKEDVSKFDLIVGLEPCDATEHIIRSSMNNNIPCAISLCCTAHDSIDGQKFIDQDEWYDYLLLITDSKGVIEKKRIMQKTHKILKIEF
jgi:SAM-dependent methyltransferase